MQGVARLNRKAKVAALVFALMTVGLVVFGFLVVPPAQRFHFMGWAELSLGGLFVSLGIDRRQSGYASGSLYIGVGVFLVVVVLVGTLLAPAHAH